MQNQPSTSPLNREPDQADSQSEPQTTAPTNTVIDLESELSAYVRWALRKSNSGDYPIEKSMRLLEKAWKAQKVLWRLRRQELSCPTEDAKLIDQDRTV